MIKSLKIRQEVEDERFEPAVDLGDVVKGTAPSFVLFHSPKELTSRIT